MDKVIPRDRTPQSVHLRTSHSAPKVLRHGVLQVSILGPLLIIMYTGEIDNIICPHGLNSHGHADDCGIYFYCNPSENDNLMLLVLKCINDLSSWISSHMLKLNPGKTKFIWAASPGWQCLPINVLGDDIFPQCASECLIPTWEEIYNTNDAIHKLNSQHLFLSAVTNQTN